MGIWDFIQDEILGMKWLNRLIGSVLNACGLDTSEKIGGSVQFFIYDVIKIMVLLGVLIFLISYIQSYFPPERTKKILGRFHGIGANCIAALLGEHESAIQDYTEAVRINPKKYQRILQPGQLVPQPRPVSERGGRLHRRLTDRP